ncbi:hypothetical protein F2Q69_00041577 [Brassica cretica]|uniref:Uncharacterized protein n=1 Tax=Brassica cretica TaxID=69181 RepID=A0A8S9NLV7_BRACR|nr:hypothetical protein F2Q69_00041577 [Brassica cretica]
MPKTQTQHRQARVRVRRGGWSGTRVEILTVSAPRVALPRPDRLRLTKPPYLITETLVSPELIIPSSLHRNQLSSSPS